MMNPILSSMLLNIYPAFSGEIILLLLLVLVIWLILKIVTITIKNIKAFRLLEQITFLILGISCIVYGFGGIFFYPPPIHAAIFAIGCIVFYFSLRALLRKQRKVS